MDVKPVSGRWVVYRNNWEPELCIQTGPSLSLDSSSQIPNRSWSNDDGKDC